MGNIFSRKRIIYLLTKLLFPESYEKRLNKNVYCRPTRAFDGLLQLTGLVRSVYFSSNINPRL